jgi:hypothetical protein
VKTRNSSRSGIIRHESELAAHFRELTQDCPDLHWTFEAERQASASGDPDCLALEFDGRRFEFRLLYALKPSVPWLEKLEVSSSSPRLLLVTPDLSPRILKACKEHNVAAIDLNGRAWLRAHGLLVDRGPLQGRSFSYELEPRNIFVGKSARIIRCLLTDRDCVWTQAEIVRRTGASSGLVSRIIQHLISQGFVEKITAREFRLRDWLGLLDSWADSDRFPKRVRSTLYAGFFGSPQDLADRLQKWAAFEKVRLAFTQWSAAWTRHPYTEPAVCSAYVDRVLEAVALDELGLRPVSEGGKLWLHTPDDEGLFTETQHRGGLTLVSDAQIYLDLQRTGLRGPDAASALREWEGFCRP